MDLAEIRKKARPGKGQGKGKGASASTKKPDHARSATSIQGAPEEMKTAGPSLADPGPILPEAAGSDPLEALFGFRPDINLATEESYLQGGGQNGQESQEGLRQWLAFSLGKEEYALDIESVGEIIKPREITELPRAPDFILGIISLRGIIVPVFDLKKRLKLGAVEISPASRIIVCQAGDRRTGLFVENITQVIRIPQQKIEPPPAVLSGLDRDLVEGVGRHQGRMMILLHLASVLNAELA